MTNEYSIKDLERITGIKAHTIRIWEKRYDIVKPERTVSNIRHYSDDELKHLLNVSVLVNNGHKISKVAGLSEPELSMKIIELNDLKSPECCGQVESLIVAMIDMDEEKFEKVLNASIIRTGFENTLFEIIYPLMKKTGILWQTGTITSAQEHFLSNMIMQKLFAAIDTLSVHHHAKSSKSFLLILPEWELHDIGLLVYKYLIRRQGHKTIFLGQGVPLDDVIAVKNQIDPDIIVTSFSSSVMNVQMTDYLFKLNEHFSARPIYVCGLQAGKLHSIIPNNIQKVATALDFRDKVLKSL
ncbi:MAG: MerR family transcriptional regulator [Bacteroidota bacterium]